MSFRLREGHRIFIFSEYVDLGAGFDKLSMYVREKMKSKLVGRRVGVILDDPFGCY